MKNKENASNSLGALLNKSDTIIAIILTLIIAFLWFETTKFEKVPDLFSNNIPPEMFPQILLIIILGMVLIIPFEHIFLKKNGKNIIIVSSGSIALGKSVLNLSSEKLKLDESQASAAIGQIKLAQAYDLILKKYNIYTAQILLTSDDSQNRRRYLNIRSTFK